MGKQCPFQPNLQPAKSTRREGNKSLSKNQPPNNPSSAQQAQTSASNRNLQLYQLARQTTTHRRDISTEEIEYEKQKQHCTFKPNLSQLKSNASSNNLLLNANSPSQCLKNASTKAKGSNPEGKISHGDAADHGYAPAQLHGRVLGTSQSQKSVTESVMRIRNARE